MFNKVLSFFLSLWGSFGDLVKEIVRQCGVTLANAWTIGLAVIAAVWTVAEKIKAMVAQVAGIVDQLAFPSVSTPSSGPLTEILAVANTFLPLDTMMLNLVQWGALLLALTVYKLVKSWIPTLA